MNSMTLEAFTERIKKAFSVEWGTLSPSEVEEYFDAEKTQRIIKNEYDKAQREVNEGKLTEEQMEVGRVGAVAGCLALMY